MRMTPLSMIGSSFGSIAAIGRLFIPLR
jgi:hypothetical protein